MFKKDTTIYTIDELVGDCLFTFEKFHKQYIIIPSLSLNPLLIEEKPFVTVRSPPGFVNQENEIRCDLNLTFQCSFQGAGIQNQLLYHSEWSEKIKSTFSS